MWYLAMKFAGLRGMAMKVRRPSLIMIVRSLIALMLVWLAIGAITSYLNYPFPTSGPDQLVLHAGCAHEHPGDEDCYRSVSKMRHDFWMLQGLIFIAPPVAIVILGALAFIAAQIALMTWDAALWIRRRLANL
jgi:hypothetical protein